MRRKQRHQQKDEHQKIIKAIKGSLQPTDKFPLCIVTFHTKKLLKKHKTVLINVYLDNQLEYQATFTAAINETDKNWQEAPIGKSEFAVLTLSSRDKNFWSKAVDFVKRSFEDGKIQDFLPW